MQGQVQGKQIDDKPRSDHESARASIEGESSAGAINKELLIEPNVM